MKRVYQTTSEFNSKHYSLNELEITQWRYFSLLFVTRLESIFKRPPRSYRVRTSRFLPHIFLSSMTYLSTYLVFSPSTSYLTCRVSTWSFPSTFPQTQMWLFFSRQIIFSTYNIEPTGGCRILVSFSFYREQGSRRDTDRIILRVRYAYHLIGPIVTSTPLHNSIRSSNILKYY